MSWNYRVMKRTFEKTEEPQFAIYEVYYDDSGEVKMWSAEPMFICGDSLLELVRDFTYYAKAFEKPVLDYNELEKRFIKEEKENDGNSDSCANPFAFDTW